MDVAGSLTSKCLRADNYDGAPVSTIPSCLHFSLMGL